ncbi:cyclin-dependent kinase 11B isoform X1 [Anabrus simplex]|uniref:cyclin-dependent kinase 11B isoform X1 n=1 Tax=Anabrus simplex TaxID=316456 RepID=UPI0034DD9E28
MEIVLSGSSDDDLTESLNIKPPQASNSMTQAYRNRSPKQDRRSTYSSDTSSHRHSRQRSRDVYSRRKHHHRRHRHGYKSPERDLRELLLNKRGERRSSHSARRVLVSHQGSERTVDKLRVKVERQVVMNELNAKSKHSIKSEHRTDHKDLRHTRPNSDRKRSSSGNNNNHSHHRKRHRKDRSLSRSSDEKSDSESFSGDGSGNGKVPKCEIRNSSPKKDVEDPVEVVVSSSSEDSEEDSDDSSSTKTADSNDSDPQSDGHENDLQNSPLKHNSKSGDSDADSIVIKDIKEDNNAGLTTLDSPKCDLDDDEDDLDSLPPYLPAIQGCRSVEEFQCLNKIEEGSFGVVYRARDKRTQEVVALKKLKMAKEKEGFPITALREINTLLKSQHPNIVTVREIVVGSNMDQIFIVMDFVEQDLNALMRSMKKRNQMSTTYTQNSTCISGHVRHGSIPVNRYLAHLDAILFADDVALVASSEDDLQCARWRSSDIIKGLMFLQSEVKCLMQQLLLAVAHLHDNWILHRDLKTSNLLLDDRGVLKVGDFGLAREYGSPLKPYTPLVVTLWYRSPELLLTSKVYSTHVDIWAVGCVFGELITLQPLFPGKTEAEQVTRIFKDLGTPTESSWPGFSSLPMVQKLGLPTFPVNQLWTRLGHALSDAGMDLMNKFLTYNPTARITAEVALQHKYFVESPVPTLPSKAALEQRKPGKEMKSADGFHIEKEQSAASLGFSLKF